jgi:hypothetical protein
MIRRATNLSKSVAQGRSASKGRWQGRYLQSWDDDDDDASRRTERTDKTEKRCNTSKEKKLEKVASRRRSRTSKTFYMLVGMSCLQRNEFEKYIFEGTYLV